MTILQPQIIISLCDPSYAITSTLPIRKNQIETAIYANFWYQSTNHGH